MKYLSAILAILVAFFMVGSALGAQHQQGGEDGQDDQGAGEAQTSFTLTTQSDDEGFFFTLEEGGQEPPEGGGAERNPTLDVPADEEITITVRNGDGEQHNLCVELETGEECTGDVSAEGDEAELTFTAPSEGSLDYWCDYHDMEMMGQIQVAAQDDEGANETDEPQDPFDPQDPGDPADGEDPEDDDQDTPGFALVAVLAAFALVAFVGLRRRR